MHPARTPADGRKLNIGYVSPNFQHHAVAWSIEPVFTAHDRRAFRIFLYSTVANPDAVTRRFMALCDEWRDIHAMPPDEAARAPATADYWSVGPCFATPTKADAGAALGAEGFTALAKLAPESCPVIGIGGISVANAGLIKGAGAVGVAVVGAVLTARDPESATRELSRALQ